MCVYIYIYGFFQFPIEEVKHTPNLPIKIIPTKIL